MGEETEDDRQEKTNSLKKLYQNEILRVLMLMTGVEFWRNSVDALTVLRILPYTLRSKSPDILIYTRGCWV